MKKKFKFSKFLLTLAIFFVVFVLITGPMSEKVMTFVENVLIEIKEDTSSENVTESKSEELKSTESTSQNALSQYNGPYKVLRVVDGDTFIAEIDGEEQRIRMIGIDTPESVSSNENKNCEEGKIASDYTKKLLSGKNVFLEFDVGKYDKYDRILAYVYAKDMTMVNKHLLNIGYARMMTIQPNVKYEKDFYQIQKKARENNKGFWDGFDQWKGE